MYETFMESIIILRDYIGTGFIFFLYLAAFIYLFICEKDRRLRALLIYAPATILLLFLLPPFRQLYILFIKDQETYYRILWLLPLGITIAYAGTKAFQKHRLIGLFTLSAIICLAGSFVYKNPHMSRAENAHNIPTVTMNVADHILADAEYDYFILAAFPKEHVSFVRQYDSYIRLPYGREMLVPRWGLYNAVYEAMEGQETIDVAAMLAAGRALEVNYYVIHITRPLSDNPNNFDVMIIAQTDDFLIYRDELIAAQIREKYGPYLERRE